MIVYSGQNGRPVTASDGRTATVEKGSGAASETIRLTGVLHPDEKMVIDYDAGIDQEMYEDRTLGINNGGTAPYVEYTVTVNQHNAELSPKTHEIIVKDHGMRSPLIFQQNSLKVTDRGNGVWTAGTKADGRPVAESGYFPSDTVNEKHGITNTPKKTDDEIISVQIKVLLRQAGI